MEIDLLWLILLPILFALGWVTARYDRGQQRREARHVPRDILDAMSALLADNPQRATDSLLAAARSAPDAPDLHRAVGNLYRRRGMTDRAIEVHESALRNPELDPNLRRAMMLDLGRDYLAAGLFDRAEDILVDVVTLSIQGVTDVEHDVAHEAAHDARVLLVRVAERTRDWQRALQWLLDARKSGGWTDDDGFHQLAGHFCCELAETALRAQDNARALEWLTMAQEHPSPGPARRIADIRARMVRNDAATSSEATAPIEPLTCRVCGFRSRQGGWQCPGCHSWDSFGAGS